MSTQNIEHIALDLVNQRLWYELGQLVIENVSNAKLIGIFADNISKIHHLTIADVVSKVIEHDSKQDYKELLELALNILNNNSNCNSENSKIKMTLSYLLFLTKNNRLENIEGQIFEMFSKSKSLNLNEENKQKLYYLAYNFYEKVENWNNCVSFAFKCNLDNINMNDLCRYAIISTSFFDFSRIIQCEKFSTVDKEIQTFLKSMVSGNLARKGNFTIPAFVGNEYNAIVKEKIFLIEIINLCQHCAIQKCISFQALITDLNLKDSKSLIFLLMKALGKDLITGWIDSEKEMFYFDKFMPRELSEEDVAALKNTFVELRSRLRKTLEVLKS